MNQKIIRAVSALVLALAAGATGYTAGGSGAQNVNANIPVQTGSAPTAGSIRIIYS